MIPVKTDDCNFTFHLPGSPGEGEMSCLITTRTVTSFWVLELDDSIDDAAALWIRYTSYKPVTELGFVALGESFAGEMEEYPMHDDSGDGWTCMVLTDEMRDWLRNGHRIALRTHMRPPPPVSVWLQ